MDEYLMNPATGRVDLADNWQAEMLTWDDDPDECQRQFNSLVAVVQDDSGAWIEANPRPRGPHSFAAHLSNLDKPIPPPAWTRHR